MPQFDLRNIKCAKYVNNSGTITYTNVQDVGDAMTANLELRYAEGRLYAESALAEYMRKATGGTISLGVKYIKSSAQQLMFGMTGKSRSVSYTPTGSTASTSATVTGLQSAGKANGAYVGISFYAPDMVDGVEKYTCVFVSKALFGPPSLSLQTAGDSIVFNTPTTSGEFLASDGSDKALMEVAICDDENEAIAWCTAVFS